MFLKGHFTVGDVYSKHSSLILEQPKLILIHSNVTVFLLIIKDHKNEI